MRREEECIRRPGRLQEGEGAKGALATALVHLVTIKGLSSDNWYLCCDLGGDFVISKLWSLPWFLLFYCHQEIISYHAVSVGRDVCGIRIVLEGDYLSVFRKEGQYFSYNSLFLKKKSFLAFIYDRSGVLFNCLELIWLLIVDSVYQCSFSAVLAQMTIIAKNIL